MIQKILAVGLCSILVSTAANAYDYSVLNLQDRMGSLNSRISQMVSKGNVKLDDLSSELQDLIGDKVVSVTVTEDSLLVTKGDGTQSVIKVSDLITDKVIKSGEVVDNSLVLKYANDDTISIPFAKTVKDITKNDNGAILISYTDDTVVTFDADMDKHLVSAELDGAVLVLATSNGLTFSTDLSPLISAMLDSSSTNIIGQFNSSILELNATVEAVKLSSDTNTISIADAVVSIGSLNDAVADLNSTSGVVILGLEDSVNELNATLNASNLEIEALKTTVSSHISKKKVSEIVGDATNSTLLVTYNDETTSSIDISKVDAVSTAGSFSISTKEITIDVPDGDNFTINLSSLVDKVNQNSTQNSTGSSDISVINNRLVMLDNAILEIRGQLSNKTVKNIYADPLTKSIVIVYTDDSSSAINITSFVGEDIHTKGGDLYLTNKRLSFSKNNGDRYNVDLTPLFEQRDSLLDLKVTSVQGKRLSTNDLTNELRSAIERKKVQRLALDSASKSLTVIYTDGTATSIDLFKLLEHEQNNVESGKISLGGKSIVLLMKNGSEVFIDIERIYDELDGKVDKKDGMTLSSNDFTADDKKDISKSVNGVGKIDSSKIITYSLTDGTENQISISSWFKDKYIKAGSVDMATSKMMLLGTYGLSAEVDISPITDKLNMDSVEKISLLRNDLSIKYKNGDVKILDLSKIRGEKDVVSGNFNLSSKNIVLKALDGSETIVDLSPLINTLSTNDFTDSHKAMIELKKVQNVTRNNDEVTIHYTDGTSIVL